MVVKWLPVRAHDSAARDALIIVASLQQLVQFTDLQRSGLVRGLKIAVDLVVLETTHQVPDHLGKVSAHDSSTFGVARFRFCGGM
jgi:hypothetical protein